jgi:tetratricopeptide (TPR) repeat protein
MPAIETRQLSRRLPSFVVLLATASLALRRLDDSDTWWHLAAGRWIAQNGRVPFTDPFSYTVPDHAWINLQWLYDLVLYGLWQLGGADLLVLTAVAAYTTAVALLMGTLRRWVGPVTAAALASWALIVTEERFLIRPEMVSLILLGIMLRLLLTATESSPRRLLGLPLVVLLWVNTHSLFVIGLFCIACTAAGAAGGTYWRAVAGAATGGRARVTPLLACAVASVAAAFLNPYFVRGVMFPLELLTRIDGSNSVYQSIGEFRSPWSGYFETLPISAYQVLAVGSVLVVASALAARAVTRRKSTARFAPGSLALFVSLLYVSTLARRNIALFALGATPTVAMALAILRDAIPPRRRASARILEPATAIGLIVAGVVFAGWVASNRYYRWNGATHAFGLGVYDTNFPIAAARFAAEARLQPHLYNDLSAGGYLTWAQPVSSGVFIDGRLEVYDTEFFSYYRRGLDDPSYWYDAARKYDIRSVIIFHRWPNRHALIRRLAQDPRWRLVHKDEVAVVFAPAEVAADLGALTARYADETASRLRERRAASWQYPAEQATALRAYAELNLVLGDSDAALAAYDDLLTLGIPPLDEADVRYRYAVFLARRGDANRARLMLERARALLPADERVTRLLDAIGHGQ